MTKFLTYIFLFLFTFTSSVNACYFIETETGLGVFSHETGHAVYGDNEDTANYLGSRFTDAYTDGLWINGVDSNLGTWTPGIKNPFYVKQNTSDFSQVKNRDDFILEALIIGAYYVGVSYFAGDGDILEGNRRMKNTDAYKYTFGAVNNATGYVVGKGIEGTDYLLNKTGITNSEYYLSEQIGKGLKWYENNVSEKTRNWIGYVGDVTNVALIGASTAKIIDKAVNKTISATKSLGNKLNKSIDKTVDGMTIDFGDTLPKSTVDSIVANEMKPVSSPLGHFGSEMKVVRGTNVPAVINNRYYTGHALDQMQGRGLTTTVVENTISVGKRNVNSDKVLYYDSVNNVSVITNKKGDVITVYPGKAKLK